MDAPTRGPYIRAALFAETIIEEKNGVKTVVRIIDRVTATIQAADPPEAMPPMTRPLNALISLKPGDARGRQNFALDMERPDGQRSNVTKGSLHFEGGPGHGADLLLRFSVTFELEGVYWFDFSIDGHLLTRMPFEIRYTRISSAPPPGALQ